MKITNAELKFMRFSSEDVIATSGMPGPLTGQTISGAFYLPDGSGLYHGASGTFGNYSNGAYQLLNYTESGEVLEQADMDRLIAACQSPNGMIDSGMGYPIPASVYTGIAKQTYVVYSYNDGYYTNGISYYEQYHQ